MANETTVTVGTAKTLESSGASLANNTVVAATTAYSRATDGANYPDGRFVFTGAFATAPTENSTLDIYAVEQNISSTNNEQAIETTYKPKFLASIPLNNVTTTQYIESQLVRRAPAEFVAHVHNNATGQTLSSTWTLVFKPETFGTA